MTNLTQWIVVFILLVTLTGCTTQWEHRFVDPGTNTEVQCFTRPFRYLANGYQMEPMLRCARACSETGFLLDETTIRGFDLLKRIADRPHAVVANRDDPDQIPELCEKL